MAFPRPNTDQTGFTLIEIMVGLAIGMLATVVIMQVLSVFETQKRVTTGTADAQTNGNIALYEMGRDLQAAGYALMPVKDSPLECIGTTFGATGKTGLSPVSITEGAVSDSVTIRYGTAAMGGIPTKIVNPMAGNTATVRSTLGCSNKDIVLVMKGALCAMTTASSVSASPRTIELADDTAIVAGAAIQDAEIACLGSWNEITYAVNNGNLERDGDAIVAGIVNIQAQYGISNAANDNQVAQWVNATGAWAAPTETSRNQIKAIRIAVVARNEKMEATAVTDACSSTSAANPTGLCAWDATSASAPIASDAPTIDLSADHPNWKKYRYRVFETVIPLRNVIWAKSTL